MKLWIITLNSKMQKVFYRQVLGIIFCRLSETEKEMDTVALMMA